MHSNMKYTNSLKKTDITDKKVKCKKWMLLKISLKYSRIKYKPKDIVKAMNNFLPILAKNYFVMAEMWMRVVLVDYLKLILN